MTCLVFYEKPGCITNNKQKALLRNAGIKFDTKSLIDTDWSRKELREYFGSSPVENWINSNAPQVKAGEVLPESLSETEAINLMLANPILIRRPLIKYGTDKWCGFDMNTIARKLGIEERFPKFADTEKCSLTDSGNKTP